MRFWFACLMIVTVAVTAELLSPVAVAAAQQQASSSHPTYTDAQADRGKALYTENCALCHGGSLMGTVAAPALAGGPFTAKWHNKPLSELLDYMQIAMPLLNPGGLSRQQNADILAFMLRANGVPAGRVELPSDGPLLQGQRFLAKRATTGAGTPESTPVSTAPAEPGFRYRAADGKGDRSDRFYTDVQAERGRVAYNRHCAACHSIDPKQSTPGRLLGGQYIEQKREGDASSKKLYPSVYYLYTKLASMPPWDTRSIGPQTKVDIIAYMLQANGFPAGAEELTPDTARMKQLMLDERGFQPIFNGRDFTGIKFVMGWGCRPAPIGCGGTDPGSVVNIVDGAIACAPLCNMHGIWYPDRKYLSFTLRFDYRFGVPEGWDDTVDDEIYCGQSGYFLFVEDQELRVNPPVKYVLDGLHCAVLKANALAAKTATVDDDARQRVRKRVGEWNSVEIVSKSGEVRASLNGTLITRFTHSVTQPGRIVFQMQGSPIYWRNIRIKPE